MSDNNPYSSRNFRGSIRVFTNLYAMVFAAILVAISVTGKLFAVNIGADIRISYENLPIVLSGMVFGPFVGLVVGVCSDLCGCLTIGYAINPIITLGSGCIGLVSGSVSLLFKKKYSPISIIGADFIAHIIGSIIIKTIGLTVYLGLGEGFFVLLAQRSVTYLIVVTVECFIFIFLLKNRFIVREINSMLSKKSFSVPNKETHAAMTYDDAVRYIHSVCWKGSRPGLQRITELCARLGDPQNDLKFIHVTGTNGKGSTCAMTESVLRAAGYKTGLFTSPYVKEFNERMRVNGENVSNERLAYVTSLVKPHADAMQDAPTEFELITAIAFMLFKLEGCDIVVLEAGMGGRLDSTNVIEKSVVSVITGVALEHTEYLGDTVEKIATEKAGIIKEGCPVVYGGSDASEAGEAFRVIKERANVLGSDMYCVDSKALIVKSATLGGTVLDYKEFEDIHLSLLGLYQPQNCSRALEIISVLRTAGYVIDDTAIKNGIAATTWRARFEKLLDDPLVLYDGSHNPEGIDVAYKTIKHYFGEQKVNVLTGVMADKDYSGMMSTLAPLVNEAFCITPENPRSLPANDLKNTFEALGVKSKAFESTPEAVKTAIAESKKANVPLICLGSLYMYKEITDAM